MRGGGRVPALAFVHGGREVRLLGRTHQQVDDGPYAIVDDDTLTIGNATFTYAIEGNTLLLTPDMAPNPADRDPAIDWQWAATVALAGHPWTRVEP